MEKTPMRQNFFVWPEDMIQFSNKGKGFKRKIVKFEKGLKKLSNKGMVPESVAEYFIERSAWWVRHPCGRPVRAPRHADNIYGEESDWRIDFGRNTFLLRNAIVLCGLELKDFLEEVKKGRGLRIHILTGRLRSHIAGSVKNSNGNYRGNYPLDNNKDLIFGTQSISTNDFIDTLFEIVPVIKIYPSLSFEDKAKAGLIG